MSRRDKFRVLGSILFVIVVMSVIFTISFLITNFAFPRLDYYPTPLLGYMINIVLGLVLCFTTIVIITRFFQPRNNAFIPLIEAIQRMAKGDFTVRVDDAVFRDNDIMSQLAQSINTTAAELNKLEQMRQEFISNVSHELQSPLTSIRGFARALQNEGITPEDHQHYLAIIETESIRLSRITENLLKLAALEAENPKFEPKPYALDKQIRDLILASEPQWMEKEIEVDAALQPASITADEDLLSQVWTNLISNSIKFTPAGGKISIALKQEAANLTITVQDTGMGISEAAQARIFERFYKSDLSRNRCATSGSGLGLSIAKKIIDMHHGTIAVASAPDCGTCFTISLPAAQAS
ncbi:MAG: HAMP domain-containing histidine kinase [Chloroflexi bacterium]|nr:HAMP domain-containing histidine kinase [Chloroflexota bacterium]